MKHLFLLFTLLLAACTDTLDDTSKTRTIILPGLPNLEWMTENLTGYGGTEVDGRWYYTWEEAMAAVKQMGDGWRLPTPQEFEALCDLGSTWDGERKGRWFGGNHGTDHKGSLFFPATGSRYRDDGALGEVGTRGKYWYLSSYIADGSIGYLSGILEFSQSGEWTEPFNRRSFDFPVRFVRNVDHDSSSAMPNLEWMTENLSGYGGTEVDGRWYYTWDEAKAAARQLGDGWRLPTNQEFWELYEPGSTWDDENKGRWFGGNYDTDHKGSLFFPAAGNNGDDINEGVFGVGRAGYYWSSTYDGGNQAIGLWFSACSDNFNLIGQHYRSNAYSVRCVRNVL